MALYSAILFIHVIATLFLAGALGIEAMALRRLTYAVQITDAQLWLKHMQRMRVGATACLLILFFSGGYLTDRLSMWRLAWPKIAVAVVVAFGALAGISGTRVGRIRKVVRKAVDFEQIALTNPNAPFLRISLSLRVGLVLAAVFLMTLKPNFMQSVGAVLAFISIFWIIGAVGARKKRTQALRRATGGIFE
jgi:hypothetical protein